MDYALLRNSDPAATWEEVRSQRRKNQRNKKSPLRSRKNGSLATGFWNPVKAVMSFLMKLIMAAGCCYGLYTVYLLLTTSPQFAVSQVTFTGNKKLNQNTLMKKIQPVAGQNIFLLDLKEVAGALQQHPWVRTVSVRKVYPHSLQVNVVERKPYSRIQVANRVFVMDNFGVLLDSDGPAYRKLPLIIQPNAGKIELGHRIAGDRVISGLKIMHYFNRLDFFRNNALVKARVDRDSRITFFARRGDLKIFMDLESISESFKNFLIVLDTIENTAKDIEHIDLSFKDQVVVKHTQTSHHSQKPAKGSTR